MINCFFVLVLSHRLNIFLFKSVGHTEQHLMPSPSAVKKCENENVSNFLKCDENNGQIYQQGDTL